MTCKRKEDPMDVDVLDATHGHSSAIKENGLLLRPVLPQESGEGFPYAPADWPQPGDTWGWKVGRRTNASGYYADRYLYLPLRLRKPGRAKGGFASKLSAEQYIRARFPDADIEAFFASFSWKIPSQQVFRTHEEHVSISLSSEEFAEQSLSDTQSVGIACKAGNKHCRSLMEEAKHSAVASMPCDVCCSEPNFCRDCCCILCCKTINLTFGGYSFIRCEATISDGAVCGHAAHINCALRSYMAGTVGGSIGLDAEYYCRHCDARTDLVKHVTGIMKTCKSVESEDDIERMLKLSICILRGSRKTGARELLNHIELALQKLEYGTELKDIWKLEENPSTGAQFHDENNGPVGGGQNEVLDSSVGLQNTALVGTMIVDRETEYLRMEKEIDQILQELRKSQDCEYQLARDRLHTQKDYISSLYEQLEKDKSEVARHMSRTDPDALLDKEEHIKREVGKLKDMEKVAKGFGMTPKYILKQHFDLDFEE
ncbi:hypothetical protein Dimus_029051 [Dionaea muscipula]